LAFTLIIFVAALSTSMATMLLLVVVVVSSRGEIDAHRCLHSPADHSPRKKSARYDGRRSLAEFQISHTGAMSVTTETTEFSKI
jgi:hypothetical protein